MKFMKTQKIALGALAALVILYLVLCLAGPAQMKIARSVDIQAPPTVIYGYLYDLREWSRWSPWYAGDTTMESTYSENHYGVGATHTWTSKNSGSGRLEIVSADIPLSLASKWTIGGAGIAMNGRFTLEEKKGCKTTVTWTVEGEDRVPFFSRGTLLFKSRSAGADYKKGLSRLKELSEAYTAQLPTNYRGVEIAEEAFAGRTYLGIRQRISINSVETFLAQGYGVLEKNLTEAGIALAGEIGALFFEWDEENGQADMAVVAPVAAGSSASGLETIVLDAGQVLAASYDGKYRGSANVHFAMEDYLRDRCLVEKAPVIEEYLSDPRVDSDTVKWQLRILYLYE
jgi:effector-binding domain-containing protein